jgi:hypothetical protein
MQSVHTTTDVASLNLDKGEVPNIDVAIADYLFKYNI